MNPSRFALLPLVATLGLASPASAADSQDQAAADFIFKQGKKFAEANDWEHACPKFVESQRLAPTAGTLLNIGNCYEKLEKLASAYGAFREAEMAARSSGDSGRQGEAARRAEALAPHLAKLAIVVPPASKVSGFEVRRDGTIVGEGQWGSSLPADMGHHEIVASAPGYKSWSTVVRINTNDSSASVEIPPLEKLPADGATGTSGATWSTQRTVGVAVGGAGIVGLAVGGILGGVTLAKASALKIGGLCNADLTVCNATGLSLRQDAKTMANASTGVLIAGGVVWAAGVVIVATGAPSGSAASPGGVGRVGRVTLEAVAGTEMTGMLVRGRWW